EKAQVGLLLDHGVEMIAAILGVLKAGKVYVPLSTGYPLNRISYMLEDSNSGLVIIDSKCTEKTKEMILAKHIGFLNIDEIGENSLNFAFHSKMGGKNAEDETAYIMYTSGSTGKPKGVIQTERNILYYIRNWAQRFSITEADRMTLFSSFCHDGSVQDMFGALLNGAALYPYDVKKRDESVNLSRFLIEEKITIWHSVPSLFNFFVNTLTGAEHFKDLRWLLLGGEPFRGYEIDMFKKYFPGAYLANVYGQTESSVNSIWTISPADTIRQLIIGQPLDNTHIFVIDEEGNTVDPLEIGEIVVACPHISPGYWQNQELTAKTFSVHPEYGLVYWTGDLGRLLVDGNIEFMGRKDFQVKISGFRVELGEIETALLRMDFIKEAVAVAKESETKGTYLCAFFTAQKEIPVSDLRNSLINELPDYMIPRHFIQLEKMPLTQSGKIDRKNLLTIEPVKTSTLLSQPEKDIEKKIAHIWAEVLNLDAVGLHDNIFEIGGNSFDIIKINNKLSDLLRMNIPLVKLFEYTTINDLTGYLTRLLEGKESAADSLKKYTSIEPAEKKEYYALSPGQKRLYILQQMVMANTSYNLPYVIPLKKYMEKEKLESVFKKLIERHESLRTCFIVLNEEPVQKINERINFSIPCSQITEVEAKCIISNFSKPFELSHAPLLRVELLNVDSTRQILLIDMHHIITDGVSQNILEKEFMALYTGEQLPPLKLQYKDYSEWQNSEPQKSLIRKQKNYWLELFAGEVPVLNLPIDFPRPLMQSFAGSHVRTLLTTQESKLIKDLAKQTGTTLYMCILSAFIILLSRLSGQEDIVTGTPVASRKHVDLAGLIGMFVNTLALRNYPNNEKNYNNFLLELKENTLNAYANQDYHFEDLVDNLPLSRDTGRNPVFDVMFNLLNIDEYKGDIPQMEEELYVNSHQQGTAKFDLTLTMVELGERFLFTFEYCIHLFKPETIDRFIAYFKMLLHDIAENHDKKLWQLEIISETEKHKLIYDFNKSDGDYNKNITVHRLFEEHAAQWPDHIAVTYSAIKITYRELDMKAGRLAGKLKQNGVGPDNIVGINLDRSVEMIIGLLGILKSGGAYLPIDPDYPQERIDYMLKDSNTKILITNKSEIRNSKFETNPNDKLSGRPRRGLSCFDIRASDLNSANLAYVIYTSGSTGKPKGVSIQHRSIVNFIQSITRFVSFTAKTYVYSLTTISFDIFVLETLLPLTQGAAVTVGSRHEQINPSAAAQIMMREKITIFQSTPSRLQTMIVDTDAVKALGGLNYLLVGGEVFSPILLDKIKEIVKGKIYNLYGPTETTVWSTIKDVTGKQSLNIGGPISNTRIYILSPYGNLQPVGVFGELYIAGDGLARGYLNNPEMTAEKFIKNYRSNRTNIFYRTGDLARWLPDGNIEIFGRIDSQVKIRGYRIELSEIEKQLITYPDVKEAVVAVHDHDGNKYLCAYFTSGIELNIAEIQVFLAKILPTYMLPAYFMQIEKIPLTPNGKINSRALPAPDKKCNHRYAAPRDSIETSLTRLWADILTINVNLIGIDDSFFELGGNSLNAAILLSKIHQSFEVK
ncbi:MAG TPA: amino acid adenylation domain-containing protein, partial [Candidatus Kapabacteria bacterium]|nr:amino acid adenylation domain-containing protein [Candidatus Kapabacteria bacterium]